MGAPSRVLYCTRALGTWLAFREAEGTAMTVKKNRKKMDHHGSTFDSFLEEEGIREEVEAVAIKRVLAWQLEQAMRKRQETKPVMAKQLHTSRSNWIACSTLVTYHAGGPAPSESA